MKNKTSSGSANRELPSQYKPVITLLAMVAVVMLLQFSGHPLTLANSYTMNQTLSKVDQASDAQVNPPTQYYPAQISERRSAAYCPVDGSGPDEGSNKALCDVLPSKRIFPRVFLNTEIFDRTRVFVKTGASTVNAALQSLSINCLALPIR